MIQFVHFFCISLYYESTYKGLSVVNGMFNKNCHLCVHEHLP